MTDIRGPVTVVTGKNRRLTIIECPNDLGSMIDMGKIADLVLLMIDGSFGLEMVSILPPTYIYWRSFADGVGQHRKPSKLCL